MKTLLISIATMAAASIAQADWKYFGVYVDGKKMGYTSYLETPDQYDGRPATRTDSHWEDRRRVDFSMDSTSWDSADNRPLRTVFNMARAGFKMHVDAVFGPQTAEVELDINGKKSHKSAKNPAGPVFADEDRVIRENILGEGNLRSFWEFETGTQSFVRLYFGWAGHNSFTSKGKSIAGLLVEMSVPSYGFTKEVYMNDKGENIWANYPYGLSVVPEPKEAALSNIERTSLATDLVEISSLRTDIAIQNFMTLSDLKFRVAGVDLSKIPSDEHQTVTSDGEGWIVSVHPTIVANSGIAPIAGTATGKDQWIRPSPGIPSDSDKMKALAARIIRKSTDVVSASEAIRQFVFKTLKPEIGFDWTRDADQVLGDRSGKSTDYAVLTTSLLRGAGIPSRVVSGWLAVDARFFQHAWSEFWDGRRWVAIDASFPEAQVSANHIKLSQGGVDEASKIPYADPEKVKIQVLLVR